MSGVDFGRGIEGAKAFACGVVGDGWEVGDGV